MALYPPSTSKALSVPGKSEFEILKASHKFLREGDDNGKPLSWDEQLASKYYDSLFREYAVCDLKHYKSGNFALRWRTEAEVLAGAGETTCGNTRCKHHDAGSPAPPPLSTLELPFTYTEHGEAKSALVKAVLCEKCLGKMMWKRRKEKEQLRAEAGGVVKEEEEEPALDELDAQGSGGGSRRKETLREGGDSSRRDHRYRRRNSRSRSPRPSGHRTDHVRPRRDSPIR
ncbi:folate-sensitive fragile site protein Fra10Ac1-domain-containing protein [Mycena maculata]|uniref:Folate-sensitive fragile site protein Fra10Ac1-domain-containing protein n=1 Tax=Mycena maculata TaxID=230809 RepID=A0AAD7J669_9AGAR|nr:folate-sensitive fragile site protein Fra10Ac1-domain-containing protein [Mycena maculata]